MAHSKKNVRFFITGLDINRVRNIMPGSGFDQIEDAEEYKKMITKNNNPETINSTVGTDIQVTPVDCHENGDPVGSVLDLVHYKIYQDNKVVKEFKYQSGDFEPFKWLLNNQGQSINWALRHGGWKVEEINETTNESKFWQPYDKL